MPTLMYSMPEMLRSCCKTCLYIPPSFSFKMPLLFFLLIIKQLIVDPKSSLEATLKHLTPSQRPGSTRVSIKIGSTCGTPSGWLSWKLPILLDGWDLQSWYKRKNLPKPRLFSHCWWFKSGEKTIFWMYKTFKHAEKTTNFNWWVCRISEPSTVWLEACDFVQTKPYKAKSWTNGKMLENHLFLFRTWVTLYIGQYLSQETDTNRRSSHGPGGWGSFVHPYFFGGSTHGWVFVQPVSPMTTDRWRWCRNDSLRWGLEDEFPMDF